MRSLLLALLVVPALAFAQGQDFSKVQFKPVKVAGNVYLIEASGGFAGGNILASVGPDGILLVDDSFEPLVDKLQAALKSVSDQPIKFLLNTHFHGDHTGGSGPLGLKSIIIAQANVRKRLEVQGNQMGKDAPAPKSALPVITYLDAVSLWHNGEEIRASHPGPGHTDGDSFIYFTSSKVVHLGDDFFNGIFPFIDAGSGGSVKGYIAAQEKAAKDYPADTKFVPGHGPVGTLADLKATTEMLKGSYAAVEAGVKAGKTLDQIKKEKPLAKYAKWAKGFLNEDRFTELLYAEQTHTKFSFP